MSYFGPHALGGPLLESDIDRWVTRACLDATTAIRNTPYTAVDWVWLNGRPQHMTVAPEHIVVLPRAPDQSQPMSLAFSKAHHNTGYDEFRDIYTISIKFRGVNMPNAPQDRVIETDDTDMNEDEATRHVTAEIRKLAGLLRVANRVKERVSRPDFQRKVIEKHWPSE